MHTRALAMIAFLLLSLGVGVSQLTVLGSFTTDTQPSAIAINPVTNTVYVANYGSNTVTIRVVGNPASSYQTTGTNPDAIAINYITNMAYIANFGSGNVTVLNGATNTVAATVNVGANPIAIAADTRRNRIYVANNGSDNVTVIDGATNKTWTVKVGSAPLGIAVNISNGWIYVANDGSANVSAINPSSLAVTTIPAGTDPTAIAVNPFSNKIYVANGESNNVTIINGATNTVAATVGAGSLPNAIVINPVTNEVYVANGTSGGVTVIDGTTNATSTIAVGSGLTGMAVNPSANQIYVSVGENVINIDGGSEGFSTLDVGSAVNAVAVNPLTGLVFADEPNAKIVAQIDPGRNLNIYDRWQQTVLVNPATNHIYSVGLDSIVDFSEATKSSVSIPVNCCSVGAQINPVMNKIYFIGTDGKLVQFDGSAHTTNSLDVGANAQQIALNVTTNTIYVFRNDTSPTVTQVDGNALTVVKNIPVANAPCTMAMNPATDLLYMGCNGWMSVLDAVTGSEVNVTNGCGYSLQVDTNLNKAYAICPNGWLSYIVVEYGQGGSATAISIPTNNGSPVWLATNANSSSTWIAQTFHALVRGDTSGKVRDVPASATGFATDPATNVAYPYYVSPSDPGKCTITRADGTMPYTAPPLIGYCVSSAGIDPITGGSYLAAPGQGGAGLEFAPLHVALPVTIAVTPTADSGTLSGTAIFATTNASPNFTIKVTTSFKPNTLGPLQLYYQLDRTVGTWQAATLTSTQGADPATYSIALSGVPLGVHTLYTYAPTGDIASNIQGTMFAITSTQVDGTPAAITGPAPGKLSSTTATFSWTQGTNVSKYRLTIGTTLNGNDVADITTVSTSTPVTLPNNGGCLYVALQSEIGGAWRGNQYVYYAPGTGTAATITSPSTSDPLASSQKFTWTSGSGISQYVLYVGTTPGADDIANINAVSATSTTVYPIATNGQTLYVYLWSLNGKDWLHEGYTYYASGEGYAELITSPANNTHFTSAIETFDFWPGEGLSEVVLQIGTKAGAHDIDSINVTGLKSYQVTNLPTNGSTIYVTLASLNGKTWLNEAYTFTAAGSASAQK